jgi:hypothetical protein
MVALKGPIWPGGFETITSTADGQRYETLYLPDAHNDELQREGKAPVYYWMPNSVRIARQGDTGDYKFHLTHFVGVRSADTTVGVPGTEEVAGGVLALTVTMAPPLDVLQASHEQLLERLRADERRYWGWRTPARPEFAPMPISSSRACMSSLSPRLDGTVPAAQPPSGGVTGTAEPSSTAAGPGGAAPRSTMPARLRPRLVREPRSVRADRDAAPTGLGAWYMRIEGEGASGITPTQEHAFSALCGSLPTALLWSGFHGTYSPIVVSQALTFPVWSENLRIRIRGNWDRIFEHFSTAAGGKVFWFGAEIKQAFNNLRIGGGITVEVEIDGTTPAADKMKEAVDKRIDRIVDKFTEEAKARIFDPAPPEVKPAGTPDGGLFASMFSGGSAGFSLNYRRDETKLDLTYDETRQEKYNQPAVISSSLEGFYNQIKQDPDAEKKYFSTLYLDDWDRKITHTVMAVASWPDRARQWVGDPVAWAGCQIGYPATTGELQWTAHVFQSTDTGPQTTWRPAFAKKNAADVTGAPAGWTPDVSYVKRTISFTEPPSETENPYVRCFVEKNLIELDPEPNGTATNSLNLEVRADSVGKLDVGPIALGVLLDGPAQTVEVEFQALGRTDEGLERPVTRFRWAATDQEKERYWTIFTGQKDFLPRYRYRVHVIVRGGLFTKGMEWWGAWQETAGNGPLMVTVPTSEEAVTTKRLAPDSRPGTGEQLPATTNGSPGKPPVGVRLTADDLPQPQGFHVGNGVRAARTEARERVADPEPYEPELPALAGWTARTPA